MRRTWLVLTVGGVVCFVLWWLSYMRFETPQQWINDRLGKGDKLLWVGEHKGQYAGIIQSQGSHDLVFHITRHALDTTTWSLDIRDPASDVDLMDFGRTIDRRRNFNASEETARIPVRPNPPPEVRIRLWIGDNPTLNYTPLIDTRFKLIGS